MDTVSQGCMRIWTCKRFDMGCLALGLGKGTNRNLGPPGQPGTNGIDNTAASSHQLQIRLILSTIIVTLKESFVFVVLTSNFWELIRFRFGVSFFPVAETVHVMKHMLMYA